MMNGPEKSDSVIVALKLTNKTERSAAELVERRAGTEGKANWQSTHWTQRQARVSQAWRQHVHKESERNTGDPKARSGMTNRTPVRDRLGALGSRRGSLYR